MNVLLVEDDEWTANLIKRILYEAGVEHIFSTYRYNEIMHELRSDKYDYAFIDYFLRPIDGINILRLIHTDELKTKIYIMSGYSIEHVKEISHDIEYKIEGYIHKDDMEEKIKKVLSRKVSND